MTKPPKSRTLRLWCGDCGRACGRVEMRNDVLAYIGKTSYPPAGALPRVAQAAFLPFDEAAVIGVTCTSGHFLSLDADEATIAYRSGQNALTLKVSRRR